MIINRARRGHVLRIAFGIALIAILLLVSSASAQPTTFSITGTVFVDIDQNGIQDNGEKGYPGATIALNPISLNTGQTATTDSDGKYAFPNLPSGTYVEALTVPDGYTATTPSLVTITLNGNAIQNFGITPRFLCIVGPGGRLGPGCESQPGQPEPPSIEDIRRVIHLLPDEIKQEIIGEFIKRGICKFIPGGELTCEIGGILIPPILETPKFPSQQPPVEPSAPGDVKLNPSEGEAGKTQVIATGSNWRAGHTIHVLWDGNVEIKQTTVDPNGNFETTFLVPSDARIGQHIIWFWDKQGGGIKEVTFTVTSPTTEPTTPEPTQTTPVPTETTPIPTTPAPTTPTPTLSPTIPTAPSDISLTITSGGTGIGVSWKDNSDNEDGFDIGYSPDPNINEVKHLQVQADQTFISSDWGLNHDENYVLLPGQKMCFQVNAYNAAGSSDPTPWSCITVTSPTS